MNWLQNVIVGVLFFGALIILGYFTIISDSGPFAQKGHRVVIFFDNAEGIKQGSRVTVLGVPFGKVHSIHLVDVNSYGEPVESDSTGAVGKRVALTAELEQEVVFYNNYHVSLKNESILSGKIVSIDPGSARSGDPQAMVSKIPVLIIPTETLDRANVSALQYTLQQRKTNRYVDLQGSASSDPLAGISRMIEENRGDVKRTITNIASITGKINHGHGSLGRLINDGELHKDATTLVDDAQVVVREMRESLEDTREQAPVNSFVRAALTAF